MGAVRFSVSLGAPAAAALVTLQIAMMLLVTGLERWMPEHASWNVPHHDVRTDAHYFLVSGVLLSAVFRALIFAGTPSLAIWPGRWPVAAQLFLAVGVADFGSYGTHVLTHKLGLLWPIHAPHHSARRLYWLNATRMHPLDQATTLVFSLLPLAVLGASVEVLLLFDAFAIVHLMLQHSNVRLRQGALWHVIATAELHRLHHSRNRAESESNYATFFSLWDHVFGTFRRPPAGAGTEDVGLYDGATIGDGFRDQIRSPFLAWRRHRRR